MGSALALSDVTKSFGAINVLKGVTLNVEHGTRHAVIGPNGAGKSTLFNLISGRMNPSSGRIRLGDEDVTGLRPKDLARRGLGRSFQITSVFPRLSCFENVRIGILQRRRIGWSVLKVADRLREVSGEVEELLEAVGLEGRNMATAGDLSYSEQRALELAMTLSTGAKVLLLDEPTAGMSREEAQAVTSLIRTVSEGRTVVMVEHDMEVVFSLCDKVSALIYGEIAITGSPAEVAAAPIVRQAYLGKGIGDA